MMIFCQQLELRISPCPQIPVQGYSVPRGMSENRYLEDPYSHPFDIHRESPNGQGGNLNYCLTSHIV